MTARDEGARSIALTADSALIIRGDRAALAACDGWIPFGRGPSREGQPASTIDVELAGPASSVQVGERSPATFTLGGLSVRVDGDRASLSDGGVAGDVSLGIGQARLRLPAGNDADATLARRSALTATAALLLGRLGRALVHAGAVVHPRDGCAWLLVGDTHSGKSTSVVNLARAGWEILADDTLSLSREGDDVMVEGWPRTMHLDAGWGSPSPAGYRVARDPRTVLPSTPRVQPAPLAGLLFPRVEAASPTSSITCSGADALAKILRQSPWLFADAVAAPRILGLLRAAATLPAAALSLGLDSFGDPTRLDEAVREITG